MTIALAAFVMLFTAVSSGTANADPYRWCADMGGDRGGTNCYFVTLEQCRWAISGMNSATCKPNMFFDGRPEGTPIPRPRPRA